MHGNIEGLKDLFRRGLASPWDVSSIRAYIVSRVSYEIVSYGFLCSISVPRLTSI